MFLLRVVPIISITSLLLLSACGGGGGGSSGRSAPSSVTQTSSSAVSSQAAVRWIDSGAFENDPLILREEEETGAQSIERLKANGESLNLTKKMPLRGRVAQIRISPDGTKVAYLADQETDNVYELFVSNSDGSVNLKVSAPITEGDITGFSWSDDSNYLIYVHYNTISEGSGSYIAKFDGSKSSKITYKSAAGQDLAFLAGPKFVRGTNHYQFIVGDATEQRMVRVNTLTSEKLTDVSLDDIPNGGDISPNGKYLVTRTEGTTQQYLYITELSNNQTSEIYSGTTVNYKWSNSSSKVALLNAYNFTIYDAEDKSFLPLMNFEYGDINGITYKDLWNNNDAHLVFKTSGRVNDLLIVPTNGATPIGFKEFMSPMELVTYHDVSSNGNLVVFTDNNRVLTRNLDGSNLEDHTWLQSEGSFANGMWLSDNQSVLVQRYNVNTYKNVLTKIDFTDKTVASLSGDKIVNCFLAAKSTKPYCILFFDER